MKLQSKKAEIGRLKWYLGGLGVVLYLSKRIPRREIVGWSGCWKEMEMYNVKNVEVGGSEMESRFQLLNIAESKVVQSAPRKWEL
jgi:hypothetical protein